ncbi:hypothetical protein P0O24_00890 [Methanotrichaceae archaeon M04Ac]|uniref:Uncharacterized protein n=1 Tax=Candidatus Methanocrinis alkalitolerans TaxID=3033395 RepID=A0ABT5XBR0_9EURY|nr:hypothetical protein [Candidatus Methanocrinis alkalitolerans]MCR3883820.1 hypothetical protein [Methanothrix sp.]MDF0592143.1 hypothetical protein [Candidatus Methanocrinis alkalitolerans]
MDRARREAELNLLLLNLAQIQGGIRDGLDRLRDEGKLKAEFEEIVESVMREVDGWTDQCTAAVEAPPVLLRRMEVQVERLGRIERMIEELEG